MFCICDFILYLLGKGSFVLLLILLIPSSSSLIGSPALVLAPDWFPNSPLLWIVFSVYCVVESSRHIWSVWGTGHDCYPAAVIKQLREKYIYLDIQILFQYNCLNVWQYLQFQPTHNHTSHTMKVEWMAECLELHYSVTWSLCDVRSHYQMSVPGGWHLMMCVCCPGVSITGIITRDGCRLVRDNTHNPPGMGNNDETLKTLLTLSHLAQVQIQTFDFRFEWTWIGTWDWGLVNNWKLATRFAINLSCI